MVILSYIFGVVHMVKDVGYRTHAKLLILKG